MGVKGDKRKMSEIEKLNMIAEWQEQHKQLIEDLDNSKKQIEELKGLKDVATLIKVNGSITVTLMGLNNHLVSANQKIKQLEAQIDKMKCCDNCGKHFDCGSSGYVCDKWVFYER